MNILRGRTLIALGAAGLLAVAGIGGAVNHIAHASSGQPVQTIIHPTSAGSSTAGQQDPQGTDTEAATPENSSATEPVDAGGAQDGQDVQDGAQDGTDAQGGAQDGPDVQSGPQSGPETPDAGGND